MSKVDEVDDGEVYVQCTLSVAQDERDSVSSSSKSETKNGRGAGLTITGSQGDRTASWLQKGGSEVRLISIEYLDVTFDSLRPQNDPDWVAPGRPPTPRYRPGTAHRLRRARNAKRKMSLSESRGEESRELEDSSAKASQEKH